MIYIYFFTFINCYKILVNFIYNYIAACLVDFAVDVFTDRPTDGRHAKNNLFVF